MDLQKTESKKPIEEVAKLLVAIKEMGDAICSVSERAEHTEGLLEALKAMVDMFDSVCDKIHWDDLMDSEGIRKMNEAAVKARIAIGKADYVARKK